MGPEQLIWHQEKYQATADMFTLCTNDVPLPVWDVLKKYVHGCLENECFAVILPFSHVSNENC